MRNLSACTVLVVDDTEANIDLLLETLSDSYEVCVALDGFSALEMVEENPPDLILLDIMMPGMDGYEVCRRIKANPRTKNIPIVFITAMSEVEDEIKGLELGAIDYLTKPISPPIVQARVKNHLELKLAKEGLEEAHRQIVDSIRYASRIQRAVLPNDSSMQQAFPEFMVIWEPRDMVGGDIYWCRPWGEGHLLILGDCTGHGVPGAFMTLIANGALEQAMRAARAKDPADLIGIMHRLMQTWLGQNTEEGDSDDGMELGVCYIPPSRDHLIFAGARFTLFYFDGQGDVVEVSGNKRPIGYRAVPYDEIYTNRIVDILPNRVFFLTTDGLIDQIGGEKRRGFGKKRFGRLITSLAEIPFPEQGQYFLEALRNYQGEEKRRDDVSIIGFKLDKV